MRLAWAFLLHSVPVEQNGLKTFYAFCWIDENKLHGQEWPYNPAGLYAMLADAAVPTTLIRATEPSSSWS